MAFSVTTAVIGSLAVTAFLQLTLVPLNVQGKRFARQQTSLECPPELLIATNSCVQAFKTSLVSQVEGNLNVTTASLQQFCTEGCLSRIRGRPDCFVNLLGLGSVDNVIRGLEVFCARRPDTREFCVVQVNLSAISSVRARCGPPSETTCREGCLRALRNAGDVLGCCLAHFFSNVGINASNPPGYFRACGFELLPPCPVDPRPTQIPTPLPSNCSLIRREYFFCFKVFTNLTLSFFNREMQSTLINTQRFCSSRCLDPPRERPDCFPGLQLNQIQNSFCLQRPDGEFCTVLQLRERAVKLREARLDTCGQNPSNCTPACLRAINEEADFFGCCAGELNFPSSLPEIGSGSGGRPRPSPVPLRLHLALCGSIPPPSCLMNATCSHISVIASSCLRRTQLAIQFLQRGNTAAAEMNIAGFCSFECVGPMRLSPDCFGLTPSIVENIISTMCSQRPDGRYCVLLQQSPMGLRVRNDTMTACSFTSGIDTSCPPGCAAALIKDKQFFGCCSGTVVSAFSSTTPNEPGSGSGAAGLPSSICGVTVPPACPVVIGQVTPTPTAIPTPAVPSDCPANANSCRDTLFNVLASQISLEFETAVEGIRDFCTSPCLQLLQERSECLGLQQFSASLVRTYCIERPDGKLCGGLLLSRRSAELANHTVTTCSYSGLLRCTESCRDAFDDIKDFFGCCTAEFREINLSLFSVCPIDPTPRCSAQSRCTEVSLTLQPCLNRLRDVNLFIQSGNLGAAEMNIAAFCTPECSNLLRSRPDCVEPSFAETLITNSCSQRPDGKYCVILQRTPIGARIRNNTITACEFTSGVDTTCPVGCAAALMEDGQFFGCCSGTTVAGITTSTIPGSGSGATDIPSPPPSLCGVTVPPACPIVINPTGTPTTPTPVSCPPQATLCSATLSQALSSVSRNNATAEQDVISFCSSPFCEALLTERPDCFSPIPAVSVRLLAIYFCAQQPNGDYCTILSLRSEGQIIARNIRDACRDEQNILTSCSDSCSRAFQAQRAYLGCCIGTNRQVAAEVLGNASLIPSEICGSEIPTPCGENATTPPTTIPSDCPLQSLPCSNYFSSIFSTISQREFLQAQQNVRGLCNPVCIALANERPECYGTFEATIQNNVRSLCSIRPDGELCGVIGFSEEQFRSNNASSFECAFGQQSFNCTDSCRNVLQQIVELQGCCIATALAVFNLTSVPVYDLCEVSFPLPCESILTPTPDTPVTPVTPTIPTDCPSITAFCQEIFRSVNSTETSINAFCNSECFNLTQEMPECYSQLISPQLVAVTARIYCTERPDGKKCGVVVTTDRTTALIMNVNQRECARPAGYNCFNTTCVTVLQEYVNELGCCAGTIVAEYSTVGLAFLPCPLKVPSPCTGIPPTSTPTTPGCSEILLALQPCLNRLRNVNLLIQSGNLGAAEMNIAAFCTPECSNLLRSRPDCVEPSFAETLITNFCSQRPDGKYCVILQRTPIGARIRNNTITACEFTSGVDTTCPVGCAAALMEDGQFFGCCSGTTVAGITTSTIPRSGNTTTDMSSPSPSLCGVTVPPACPIVINPTGTPTTPTPVSCPPQAASCSATFFQAVSSVMNRSATAEQDVISFCSSPFCEALLTERPDCFPPVPAETARLLAINFCAQQPDGDYCVILSLRSEGQRIARNIVDACRDQDIFTSCSDSCSRAWRVQRAYLGCCVGTSLQVLAEVLGNASLVPSEICGSEIPTPCRENATTPPTTIPSDCPLQSLPCLSNFSAIVPAFSRGEFLQAQQNVRTLCSPVCIALANERPECYGTFAAFIQRNARVFCSIRPDGELCGVTGLSKEQFQIRNATSFECAFRQQSFNCTDSCRNVLKQHVELQGCCIATSLAAINITGIPLYDICEVEIPPLPCESIPPPTPVTPVTPTIPPDCPVQSQSCQRILGKVFAISDVESRRGIVNDFCGSVCLDLAQQRPECLLTSEAILVQVNAICTRRTDGQQCGVFLYSNQIFAFVLNITRDCQGTNCTSNSSCVTTYQAYLNTLGCCAGTSFRDLENRGQNISRYIPCFQEIQIPSPCPEGTPPPLVITLLDGSPRVTGDNVTAAFQTNKEVAVLQCRLGRGVTDFVDCSSGNISYTGLAREDTDTFVLHIQARTADGEVVSLRREFRIERPQWCSVHLLNSGNLVIGNEIVAEFTGTGPISSYTCFLDGRIFREGCTSPMIFSDLQPGRHVVKITPFGCGRNRSPANFFADIGAPMIQICRVVLTQPLVISGNRITVQFRGLGPYESFTCFLDRGGRVFRNCNSPFEVTNLTPGRHFIKIRPEGAGCNPWPNRQPIRVDFNV